MTRWIEVEGQEGIGLGRASGLEVFDGRSISGATEKAFCGHGNVGRNIGTPNHPGTRSWCLSISSHCGAFANPTHNDGDHDSKCGELPRNDHSSPNSPGMTPSTPGCSGHSGAGDPTSGGVATRLHAGPGQSRASLPEGHI